MLCIYFFDKRLKVYSLKHSEIKLVDWRKKHIILNYGMHLFFWTKGLEFIPSIVLKLNWWNGGRNE